MTASRKSAKIETGVERSAAKRIVKKKSAKKPPAAERGHAREPAGR